MQFAALQHCETFAHHGHIPLVEVAEWAWRRFAGDAALNHLRGVPPLLDRHLRNAWERLSVLSEGHGVPDDKYLGVAGHTEVILDAHPAGAVCLRVEPLASR